MQFKSTLLGTAFVLAVSVGSAHAADQLTTLAGVPAQPLTVDAVENAASDRFAALEGIAAEAMTTRELMSVAGGDHEAAQLLIFAPPGGELVRFPHVGIAVCNGVGGLSNSVITVVGC